MKFEREINAIRTKCQERKALLTKIEEKLFNFEERIESVERKQYAKDALAKINEVYTAATGAVEEIKRTEASLPSFGNRFAAAIDRGAAAYDKKEFLAELKKSFEIFRSVVSAIASSGLRRASDENLSRAGNAYATICAIYHNADYLIKSLREEEAKKREIDGILEEKAAYEREWNAKLERDKEEGLALIADLEAKVQKEREDCALGEIQRNPVMTRSFDDYAWRLGVGRERDSVPVKLDISAYGKGQWTFSLDERCYCVRQGKAPMNVYLSYNEEDQAFWTMLETMIARFILAYPAAFKNVAVLHNVRTNSEFLGIMGRLRRMCSANEFLYEKENAKGVSNAPDEINRTVRSLANMLDERNSKLYGYDSVLEYNKNNSDNIQPLTLVIAKDLDKERNSEAIEYLKDIARGGERVGIFVLWIGKDGAAAVSEKDKADLFGHRFTYGGKGLLRKGSIDVECVNGAHYLNEDWYNSVKKQLAGYSSAIDLVEFQQSVTNLATKDYSRTLYIPIGKQEADTSILALDSKDEYCHAVIAGTTGTGKTSLLHSIILGGAYHYTPDELEIWLFDFKQGGVEFNVYKQLKHVKMLALNSHKQDIYEILDYLIDTMEERGMTIRSRGVQDIDAYNNSGVEKKLPRIVIVIDEYTVLANSHKCIAQLEHVAKQGRAYGISLIMSSQEVDSSFLGVIKQMKHHFEFGNPSRSSLIEGNVSRFGDITAAKGTCLYQRKQGVVKMRVAYTNKIPAVIEMINEKYASYPTVKPIILENSEVIKRKPAYDGNGKLCKKDSQSLKIKLGVKNLSRRPVEYKFDESNRFFALFGDEARVKNIEYAIVDGFASLKTVEPSVYYLNAAATHDDVMYRFRENYKGKAAYFTERPADICDALHRLYDIYNSRLSDLDDGVEIEHPIEIVIHCFDKVPSLLERLANRQKANGAAETRSESAFTEAPPQRRGSIRDRSVEEFKEHARAYRSGVAESPRPQETSPAKSYPSYSEILNKLYTAEPECRIYMTLHFENVASIEKYGHFVFGKSERPDFKDAVIVPTIPDEEDVLSYKQIIDFLRAIRQHEFADLYASRGSASVNTADELNNFNYYVLIDENVPMKFLPYEYTEE